MPAETVAAAEPAHIVGIEVDVPREVRVERIQRRGPEVAVGTSIVENRAVPETGSGKEYTVPVGRFNQSTVDSAAIVVRYPSPSTLCQ